MADSMVSESQVVSSVLQLSSLASRILLSLIKGEQTVTAMAVQGILNVETGSINPLSDDFKAANPSLDETKLGMFVLVSMALRETVTSPISEGSPYSVRAALRYMLRIPIVMDSAEVLNTNEKLGKSIVTSAKDMYLLAREVDIAIATCDDIGLWEGTPPTFFVDEAFTNVFKGDLDHLDDNKVTNLLTGLAAVSAKLNSTIPETPFTYLQAMYSVIPAE